MKSLSALAVLTSLASTAGAQLVYEPAQGAPVPPAIDGDIATGDLNGDGFGDFLNGALAPNGPITVAFGDESGDFTTTVLGDQRTAPFELIDVDNDGTRDLLHMSSTPPGVALSRGQPDGTFAAPVFLADLGPASSLTSALDVGDVNGDGVVDIVVAVGSFLNEVRVLLGASDGTYTEVPSTIPVTFGGSNALGDVNGDGLDDVVVSLFGGGDLYLSNGDGSFAEGVSIPNTSRLHIVADIMGDPASEVLVTEANGELTDVVLHALDSGVFVEIARVTTPFPAVSSTAAASAADIDRDGRQDLVIITSLGGYIFLQTPDMSFDLAGSFTPFVGGLGAAVKTLDIKGNGDSDLLYQTPLNGLFIVRDATYSHDEPFTDLGGASPGSAGFPTQVFGTADATLSVRVLSAAPSAPIFAVWGASIGTLLGDSAVSPSPDRVIGPVMTSNDGSLSVSATSALPLGLEIYAQWWIVDPSMESGFSSTSTVAIENR